MRMEKLMRSGPAHSESAPDMHPARRPCLESCILARHIPKQLHGSLEISCTNQCLRQTPQDMTNSCQRWRPKPRKQMAILHGQGRCSTTVLECSGFQAASIRVLYVTAVSRSAPLVSS